MLLMYIEFKLEVIFAFYDLEINAGETYEYILYSDKKERDPLHGSYKFNLPLKKIKSQTRAVFFGDLDS